MVNLKLCETYHIYFSCQGGKSTNLNKNIIITSNYLLLLYRTIKNTLIERCIARRDRIDLLILTLINSLLILKEFRYNLLPF
jgi:hypothetical protein